MTTTTTEPRFRCGKRMFQSWQDAAAAAEAMLGQERAAGEIKPGPIRPFYCERCRAWHNGHLSQRR
jgi:hypothetical protein